MVPALTCATFVGQQKAPPAALAHIEGTVLDGITNKPLAATFITLLHETDGKNAISDSQGHFAFDTTFGTVRIVTSKDGYAAVRPEGHKLPTTGGILITVAAGQRLKDVTLRIFPSGGIAGRVFDARSKSVQYAHAQLWTYTYDESGQRSFQQVSGARGGDTNDHGEFKLTGIDPGDYYIKIEPPLLTERIPGEPFVAVYLPGTPDPIRATPVTIKSGPDMHLDDITLTSVRGGSIRAHLINQTGVKIDNTLDKYLNWGLKGTPGTTARAPLLLMGGPEHAEIPVPLGTYDIALGWTKKGLLVGVGKATVNVGVLGVDVDVPVTKGTKFVGHALLEQPTGQPKPVAGVRCDLNVEGMAPFSATSIADGSMALDNIPPRLYRIDCPLLPPDTYISQIRQGERDVLKDGLQVEGAETNVTVTLSGSVGVAQGKVTDAKGQPVAGAVVALVPDAPLGAALNLYRVESTDQLGGFIIRAVAPGSYHLFAWNELPGAQYKNADFMKKYEDKGTAVKVERGGKVTADTKLLDPAN